MSDSELSEVLFDNLKGHFQMVNNACETEFTEEDNGALRAYFPIPAIERNLTNPH